MREKILEIDFEFNRTTHPNVHLVCVSCRKVLLHDEDKNSSGRIYPEGPIASFWLCDDEKGKAEAWDYLDQANEEGYTFLSFGAIAEARSLNALQFTKDYKIVDLYVLWRQLTHTHPKYMYGKHVVGGVIEESEPPRFDRVTGEKQVGDYTPVGMSMAACVTALLGRVVDTQRKTEVRDLIISDPESFDEAQKTDIIKYCESDLLYLSQLYWKMLDALNTELRLAKDALHKIAVRHGEYCCALADQEDEGIPVDIEGILTLRNNQERAVNDLISELVKIYPFFERGKPSKGELIGEWVQKYSAFERYLTDKGRADSWPKTEKGKLKSDAKTLKEHEGAYPELKALRQTTKAVDSLGYFEKGSKGDILKFIGPDRKIRTWLAPFGTLTGRNAPLPSKGYMPAMSKAIRCLIVPGPGEEFAEPDWSSEEFLLAGIMSGDKNMILAYRSGDPYLYFAKLMGLIPPEGNADTHPNERQLAKGIVLGLQYGMGKGKLAVLLTGMLLRPVSEAEAGKYIDVHKKAFPGLWAWRKRIIDTYKRDGFLILPDGWALLRGNEADLSTGNFPVQGMGGCIFREAMRQARRQGLRVVYGLHDAIRIISKRETIEEDTAKLKTIMHEAVLSFVSEPIRSDVKRIRAGERQVEKGGKDIYNIISKYMDNEHPDYSELESESIKNYFS